MTRSALSLILLALTCPTSWAQPLDYQHGLAEAGDLDTAAQENHQEEIAEPMPYSFEYSASDPEGSHSHSSTSDGKTVTGEYSINLADGRMRTVKYRADENGYRAEIMTNELGTESKNPADVTIESSALTAAEAALQAPAPTPVAAPNAVGIDSNAAEAVSRDASASHLDHIYVQPQFASDYQQQEFQRHYYDSRYTQ